MYKVYIPVQIDGGGVEMMSNSFSTSAEAINFVKKHLEENHTYDDHFGVMEVKFGESTQLIGSINDSREEICYRKGVEMDCERVLNGN